MDVKKYYVYTLTDPRNNHIFYVGKGTGKRSESHLKETIYTTKNSKKWLKIQNILDAKLKVQIDIHITNLSEAKAFELEKLLIHKLERNWPLGNGSLLNIAPGGDWNPDSKSLYYDENYNSDFEINMLEPNIKTTLLSIIESQITERVDYPIDYKVNALQHLKPRIKGLTLEELAEKKNKALGNL